jgi:hypothetical protein
MGDSASDPTADLPCATNKVSDLDIRTPFARINDLLSKFEVIFNEMKLRSQTFKLIYFKGTS